MGALSCQGRVIPARQIGVESAHGFGDGLFNAALLKALHERTGVPIGVAVRHHCADAFENLPWVDEIVRIGEMGQGEAALRQLGYRNVYQITQNIWFWQYVTRYAGHSLIDTPLLVGRDLFGLPPFDQRPIFIPSADETDFGRSFAARVGLAATESMVVEPPGVLGACRRRRPVCGPSSARPLIAIESVYMSGQSWATAEAFDLIVDRYAPTHDIIWLSHLGADRYRRHGDQPSQSDRILPLSQCSRRQLIMSLQFVETLFCVGSGFFCAAMALAKPLQPARIVCLWRDDLYRYEGRLAGLNWHDDIVWVHDMAELRAAL